MAFHPIHAALLALALATGTAEASDAPAAAASQAASQAAPEGAVQPYVIAQTHRMASKVMGETRMLNIMLPAGYDDEPGRRYPVIYLLDGGQHEDFTHMAGAVQYASFDWVQRLPPSILVGISNTDRKRDMTFKASPGFVWPKWMHAYTAAYKNAGGSETFMRHIEAEVQPFVEREFRTNGDRMLVGQSLAALFATEVLLKKPQLFNRYVIMSPSLWWDNESLLKGAAARVKQWPRTPRQVYLAVGHEGPEMERDTKALARIIQANKPSGTALKFEFLPGEDHGTILHPATLRAFQWMNPRPVQR